LLDVGAADFAAYRSALRKSRQPTFIAWASDDEQISPGSHEALHEYAGPGPRVAFPSGGHNIQKTRAVELGEMIRQFLG
jgi:pimeloyl-ACP methyl ester carboxylesterase